MLEFYTLNTPTTTKEISIMAKRTIKKTPGLSKAAFTALSEKLTGIKEMQKKLKGEHDEARDKIKAYVTANGSETASGHIEAYFPKPIGNVLGWRNQKSITQVFDSESAEEWLRENGLWEKATTPVIDEGKVLALNQQDEIPDEVLDGFYSESESWSLTQIKE